MRVKSFHKDILRAVTHSWSRFLALLVIVALGAGFYSGLRTTAPNMRATADAYFDGTRFMDVRLVSTFGFTQDDVAAIRETEGVESVMEGYSTDRIVRMGEKDVVTRLHALPSDFAENGDDYLNHPTLTEGRMPEKSGECVVSAPPVGDTTGLAIGDTITVEDTDGTLSDTLARDTFTVVGFVQSSSYLSVSLGTSTVGSGTLGRFVYLLEDDFSQEYYTDLYLTVEGAAALNTFDGSYEDLVQPVLDTLEELGKTRSEIRYEEVRADAKEALDDAQATYDEEKAKAEQELADAYQELIDGEQELLDAEQELKDGEQEIADAKQEVADGWAQLEDAKQELADARKTLEDAEQELLDGQAEYDDGAQQLEEGKQEYEDGVKALEEAKREWTDGWSDYLLGKNKYDRGVSELEAEKEEAYAQLADARQQILDAQKQIENARNQLAGQRGSYDMAVDALDGIEQIIAVKESMGGGEGDAQSEDEPTQAALSGGAEVAARSITSEAEAAAFLASLQTMSQKEQLAAITALSSEEKAVLSAYINALLQNPALPDDQRATLEMLAGLLGGGSPDPGEDPDEGTSLTEDEIPAFLEKLQGMNESEAAAALMALDLESLYLLRDYVESAISQYEDAKMQIGQAQWELAQGKAEYTEKKKEADEAFAEAEAELADAKAQLDDAKAQLDEGRKEIADGEQELLDSKALIEENEQKLLDAQQELADGWQEYEDGRQELLDGEREIQENEQKLLDAEREIEENEQKLTDGRADLEEGKKELQDGWQEYEDGRQEAEEKLADAAQEIADGREELETLEMPEWYVLDRGMNMGYASFEGDCDRMDSLSTVFPSMFFLVAALVALTTMTRMVDEERGVIGTYKALGYGRLRIASKYLIYAAVPSILGSMAGTFIGNQTLPRICWSAYLMMYNGPDMLVVYQPVYDLIGCAASALCTLGSTAIACRSELKETPAALLLPKSPKAGKRIFLEHIGFVWKRLKFTQKVTCRNIFLYKRRLFMTIVGIAGATALLLTGYGIKDSVSGIIEKQYGEIYRYDTIISLKENTVSDGTRALLDSDSFDGWMSVMKKSVSVVAEDENYSGYVVVPENAEELPLYINLRDRRTGQSVAFEEGSVLVTEKLADLLGLSSGSTITIENEDGERVEFTVTGVVENYVQHYIYISPELYKAVTGEDVKPTEVNAVCTKTEQEQRDAIALELQEQEGVSTAGFTEDTRKSFDDLIESLNSIIVVLILCAGALAFVVLYNLTNINVTERQRELATIKVLGFRDGEVAGYIYRETSLLTLLGCGIGLVFGILMHSFVIQTMEIDMVMFGRTIQPMSFVWSALLTLLFAVIVDLVMYPKLKRIDMVESLKSVD
ncbi:FtsX-like permease family protein [Anaeromassilibacillus sp. An200]|uniref:FtsX-like permease family protein n=1 Tax=Anaeromassilibacillus sp. An200 TaxID=1965587 RepID=UPI000B3A48B0|nr:FtsX-like permease family protein [Anaeromassilibacillus sp. An200]OUP06061.1 hypothetical protein B5F35_15970 [Anaeromassilibacillus sp. An200]